MALHEIFMTFGAIFIRLFYKVCGDSKRLVRTSARQEGHCDISPRACARGLMYKKVYYNYINRTRPGP